LNPTLIAHLLKKAIKIISSTKIPEPFPSSSSLIAAAVHTRFKKQLEITLKTGFGFFCFIVFEREKKCFCVYGRCDDGTKIQ
jgi:hypothetical protein